MLNHEFLADQAVINSGFKINDYQSLLLNTLLMQPAHGLSHSFTFSLTKKRLQMMTKPNSPLRSTLKTLLTLPLFFALGFLFGCESIPADSANNQMDIHIEFTDSDHILFNGEEVQVADLEPKLKLLSEDYELHFILKDHPDMLAGPVMNVNRLVQQYRSVNQDLPENHLMITLTADSQILANDRKYSLEELETVLSEYNSQHNLVISMRVERESDVNFINKVQGLLRQFEVSRINYSTLLSSPTEGELQDQLIRAGSQYMAIPPEQANLEELTQKYEEFMDVFDSYKEEQNRIYKEDPSSLLPPPPPVPPSPQVRIEKEIENAVIVSPPPPPPPIAERNVLRVLINDQGMILVNKQPANLDDIRNFVTNFINNNGADPDLSESPTEAIIAIKTERSTPYDLFIEILDEVMGAYQDLRNQASLDHFGQSFESLDSESDEIQEIRNLYPKRISIAEPDK